MRRLRRFTLLSSAVIMLSASSAQADCRSFLAQFFTGAASGYEVSTAMTTHQSDGRASHAASQCSMDWTQQWKSSHLELWGDYLTNEYNLPMKQAFSDRFNSTCSSSAAQRFSSASAESLHVRINRDGRVWIRNPTQNGPWLEFDQATCELNLLRAYGPPIGGSIYAAQYTFTFAARPPCSFANP